MDLRSGHRLSTPPPSGASRECRPRRCRGGDGGGADRISGLHDDLLIQVLGRLRCAGAAVRTSLLSHRWRGLWRNLSELFFRGIEPGALEAALAQVALPNLSVLDIEITDRLPAGAVPSLLRTAARLDPVELSFVVAWVVVVPSDEIVPIQVPSFARATSIRLSLHDLHLTPPAQGGEFPVLERLSITSGSFDTDAMISRCPHLRVLEFVYCWGIETITVHSATIEELSVISEQLRGVDIVAPVLKKFTLHSSVSVDFSMSFLAPTVENLSCKCWSHDWFPSPNEAVAVGIHEMWRLLRLELGTEGSGFILGLDIVRSFNSELHVRNLQEMFAFPKISSLELFLDTRGHYYVAVVLNLLRIWDAIQRLKLVIDCDMRRDGSCLPNCPCLQSQNWGNQYISLMGLEEVEIENFKGSANEAHFLELLFRCAPLTKVTVKLASNVVPSSRGCKKTYNIFKANPAVECHAYLKRGDEVMYVNMKK